LLARTRLDAYQLQLAGWMKRNSVSAPTEQIAADTAVYLQKVAWETWQATQKELSRSPLKAADH
jgi:hypothetical protein